MEALFVLVFITTIAFYFVKGKKVVVFLPAILYLFDFGFQFMPTMSIITYIKLILIVISLLLFSKELTRFPIKIFYVFIAYVLILLIFTDEPFVSAKNTSKVVLSMMFLPLGYEGKFKLKSLSNSLFLVLILAFSGSIIGYVFGVGKESFYGEGEEAMGLVQGGNFYPAAISVILILYLNDSNFWRANMKKYFWLGLAATTFVLILLTLRRTAILLPLVGAVTYIYYAGKLKKGMQYFFVFFIVIMISYPLYQDVLERRFEIRAEKGRFESNFYETEARYVTTLWTFEEIFSFKDPVKSIFGRNVFAGGWENGTVQRMYHADHNQLLNTTGILGTFLYILIFYQIIKQTGRVKGVRFRKRKAVIYGFLGMLALISLNGSIFITTFRSTIFLVLGYFLGEITREYYNSKTEVLTANGLNNS